MVYVMLVWWDFYRIIVDLVYGCVEIKFANVCKRNAPEQFVLILIKELLNFKTDGFKKLEKKWDENLLWIKYVPEIRHGIKGKGIYVRVYFCLYKKMSMFPRPTYKQLFPVRRGRLDIPNPIPHFIFWCPKFSVYKY